MSTKPTIIRLKHSFELCFPTKCRCGEPIPQAVWDTTFAETRKVLGDWFGGGTNVRALSGDGFWPSPEVHGVMDEGIRFIFCNSNAATYEAYRESFVEFAAELANTLTQTEIAIRIDKAMQRIPSTRKDCLHRPIPSKDEPSQKPVLLPAKPEDKRRAIQAALLRLKNLDDVRELFCNVLHYEYTDSLLPTRGWPDTVTNCLAPGCLPHVIAEINDFKIIHIKLATPRLLRTLERQLILRLIQANPDIRGLIVVSDLEEKEWHLVNVKFPTKANDRAGFLLRRMRVGPDQHMRTAVERLALIDLEVVGEHTSAAEIQSAHDKAFDVQQVTNAFFQTYRATFEQVEHQIIGFGTDEKEARRLFTQQLFNRLMFIAFIQKKGWLKMNTRSDYLAALWEDYRQKREKEDNFYQQRLHPLFFCGLNNSGSINIIGVNRGGFLKKLIGDVPFLNGGLFEANGHDEKKGVKVPDACFKAILTDLFLGFNFTVTESTPLDQEVAVDPEMLGTIFEELITGRHEQGAYYTPKPIVQFMCREALKTYVASAVPNESAAALDCFVENQDTSALRTPEKVLDALRKVRVCDPACGSGAYLLGMLHELLDLRTSLFASSRLDPVTAYDRKLEIIQTNLYGVDLDPFATNIAKLRLWLSLAVEYDGDEPPPLPNLDFKIEQGDSLGAPGPQGTDDLFRNEVVKQADKLVDLKTLFLTARGPAKKQLVTQIHKEVKSLEAIFKDSPAPQGSFDWRVGFAEVFKNGGFDVVVANPPFVRMELIKPQKPMLRRNFPLVHTNRADLYIYFYARAHELLRQFGVAAFISSNKWLRSGYGELLRQHLLDTQAFRLVMDFGELPVFASAATDAAIFLWQKQPRAKSPTSWAQVRDLQQCYSDGVWNHFEDLAIKVPATQFGAGKSRLATGATATLRTQMERSGPRLSELCKGLIGWGIKTGLNEAFIINQAKREELVDQTPAATEVIKPLLTGDDVRRYELHYREDYLLYTYHGIDIRKYQSVEEHLRPFKSRLEARATQQEWFELQQPQMAYRSWFDATKIVYPEIGKEARFVIERAGHYLNNKCFFLPSADWFLLAVLNSAPVFSYLKEVCALLGDKDRGGRLEFRAQYLEMLPIPNASTPNQKSVGELARKVQTLHEQRRERVEGFLKKIGLSPAQSTTRNPLEQPWSLSASEYAKRAKSQPLKFYETVHDETIALNDQIVTLESEIDNQVAALYGL